MKTNKNDILAVCIKKVPKHIWICFGTAVLVGILTHMYMLTNKLVNWDEPNNLYSNGITVPIGRWVLDFTNKLASEWSVPWLHGLFAIIALSVSVCIVVATLHLRKITSVILVSIIVITFPSLASTMTFMWLVEDFSLAIMLACLGTYLIRKYKLGFLPGIICFVLSLGIYQSYICFAAGILVLGAVVDLLEKKEIKAIWRDAAKYIFALVSGLVIYMIITKMITPWYNNQNGMETMGQIDITQLPIMILRAYKRILEYFVINPFSFVTATTHIMNILCCILIVLFTILIIKKIKLKENKGRVFLLLTLLVLVPLALASIYIMAPDANMSMLMLYQYCLIYVSLIVLWEKWGDLNETEEIIGVIPKTKKQDILSLIVVACLLLIAYQNFVVTNEAYFRMDISNQRAKAYFNRILSNVEEKEGYEYGDKIAVMGEFFVKDRPNTNPLASYPLGDEKYFDFSGIALENGVITTGVRRNFMRIFLGADMPELTQEEIDRIQNSEEFKNMPNYPNVDAIKKIENIWVVKLCYDWETYQESVMGK